MSLRQKFNSVFSDWDKKAFRDIHHEDFLFIRETELLTLDEHVKNIDKLVKENDFGENFLKIAQIVHENDYISEWRWQDDDEIVTAVVLTKHGKAWRQIAHRVPIFLGI